MKADLHTHTCFSDGTDTPTEVVKRAAEHHIDVLAITDHDTMAGVDEALTAGQTYGVRVVPGVEITAQFERQELHMLAYFQAEAPEGTGWKHPDLHQRLQMHHQQREKRVDQIVKRLNALGVNISMSDVRNQAQISDSGESPTLGRPHVASALVAGNYSSSLDQAFADYLRVGRPAYVDKPKAQAHEIIELVHRAGGVVSLAHPGLLKEKRIPHRLRDEGLDGIEVYHPTHTTQLSHRFRNWAEEYHMIITGGSDCHGNLKGEPLMGRVELSGHDLDRFLSFVS